MKRLCSFPPRKSTRRCLHRKFSSNALTFLLNATEILPEKIPAVLDAVARSGNVRKTIVFCPFWFKGDVRWKEWKDSAAKYGLEMRVQPWQEKWNSHTLEVEIAIEAINLNQTEKLPLCILSKSSDLIVKRLRARGIAAGALERRWRVDTMNYFCAGVDSPENGLEEPLIKQFFEDGPDGLPTLIVADCLDISVPHLEETLDYFLEKEIDPELIGYMTEQNLETRKIDYERLEVLSMFNNSRAQNTVSLAIDTYDYCIATGCKSIGLSGKDSSMALLARALRQQDVQVIGFGKSSLFDWFRDECSIFHEFDGSKEKKKKRAKLYKTARKMWAFLDELGYLPEDCPKPFIPLDRLKLFNQMNGCFFQRRDGIDGQLEAMSYQIDQLPDKQWTPNPGDRVVHDYHRGRKMRFSKLENVNSWKMLHTTNYITKKMRKYDDDASKALSVDVFMTRNAINLPGYFDELQSQEEKLLELTLLLQNQLLPHRWDMAPGEDAITNKLVKDGYLLSSNDSPYMKSLAYEQMIHDRGEDVGGSVVENLAMITRYQQDESRGYRETGFFPKKVKGTFAANF